jgi:hypothetical protein
LLGISHHIPVFGYCTILIGHMPGGMEYISFVEEKLSELVGGYAIAAGGYMGAAPD